MLHCHTSLWPSLPSLPYNCYTNVCQWCSGARATAQGAPSNSSTAQPLWRCQDVEEQVDVDAEVVEGTEAEMEVKVEVEVGLTTPWEWETGVQEALHR